MVAVSPLQSLPTHVSAVLITIFPIASVGMFALQLAKVAGYKVVTVASPRNFDLCKALGADYVFDVSLNTQLSPAR